MADITLVQSIQGGYGQGGGSGSGNSTTSVGFAAETTIGSLLICAVYATGTNSIPNPPQTAGVTWVAINVEGYTGVDTGACAIYASYDTPVTLTTSLTDILIGTNTNFYVEFDLYEFGGIIASPFDVSATLNGPNPGNTYAVPTSVNQTAPSSSGWQGYLPDLFYPNGSISESSTANSVSCGHTGNTDIVYVNTFRLGIPSTATIEGVAVYFQGGTYVHSGASPSGTGVTVMLMDGATPIGTAKTNLFSSPYGGQLYTLGGSSDTWSASLSPTGCNASSFGIGFQQIGAHSTDIAPEICSCRIQIWWNDPAELTGTANLVTTSVDLVFVVGQGAASSGSYAAVGDGFTLGIQTFLCNFGEAQYQTDVPAGSTPTSFGSAMGGQNWACCAAAFKGTPSSGTATPTGVQMITALGPTQPGVPIDYGNGGGGSSAPLPPGVNTTYFYARWVGYLTPSVTGVYTVGLNYSDGADFYIGSQGVVQDLTGDQVSTVPDPSTGIPEFVAASKITLTANVAYPVVIEWQHGAGPDYEIQFLWTPPSRTNGPPAETQIIPEANIALVGSWWNGQSPEEDPPNGNWYPENWYAIMPFGIIELVSSISHYVLPPLLRAAGQAVHWLHLV